MKQEGRDIRDPRDSRDIRDLKEMPIADSFVPGVPVVSAVPGCLRVDHQPVQELLEIGLELVEKVLGRVGERLDRPLFSAVVIAVVEEWELGDGPFELQDEE